PFSQRLDLARQAPLAQKIGELLGRKVEVLCDLAVPSAMAGVERAHEVTFALSELPFQAGGAEAREQDRHAERAASGAEPLGQRSPSRSYFAEKRAQLRRLLRDFLRARTGRYGGVRQ